MDSRPTEYEMNTTFFKSTIYELVLQNEPNLLIFAHLASHFSVLSRGSSMTPQSMNASRLPQSHLTLIYVLHGSLGQSWPL